ncbi:tRNA (cytosine(72)-C(5))-methyltransferase NSUN6 [Chrysoperla carnea]|uniref:tRNA (cytosine(72)-C(5))-methyltransferase NSUN6 n=1 Tax=Chrysoperla carnea TaxID=189513 RepID=UPI001D0731C1|nr:tRNA (cytosine(72)-C(5))-methyltransferase NSUN6 [Chrysoperla carnea]XP_044731528.1 tRNA (cytosine(72)-C(5))-methyltransferase NSUN6 [Chrysoperla carnea]
MSYPENPFDENFDVKEILAIHSDEQNADNLSNEHEDKLNKLLLWICSSPKISSIRFNKLLTSKDQLINILTEKILANKYIEIAPKIYEHPSLPDVIIVEKLTKYTDELDKNLNEVIVDPICGAAILRGSHIFAPGVLGLLSASQIGDKVSIYADLTGECKRGYLKKFENPGKVFIGNGILHQSRKEIFENNAEPKGLAVEVIGTISYCPPIDDKELWKYGAILQNLPSIVCGHVLNPQRNDIILDMCAAPGNKTTHLATIINNQGTIIALDKNKSKIDSLKERCKIFFSRCVEVYHFDATEAVVVDNEINPSGKLNLVPPFNKETFDKILLDVPCSALGQRPQLRNKITNKELKSYVSLQRKIFRAGVDLLKTNGHLVYSTCTITLAENEGMVAWALKTFSCLKLIPAVPKIGGSGWKISSLTTEQCDNLQRFSYQDENCDSVGFFIAHFEKIEINNPQ